jgi:hypothetical protein
MDVIYQYLYIVVVIYFIYLADFSQIMPISRHIIATFRHIIAAFRQLISSNVINGVAK